jgi:hypothetical protein
MVSHAYAIPFQWSGGDSSFDQRSRLTLSEDGVLLVNHADLATVRSIGHGYFAHQDGRLVFSSSDNSDPRTNGRDYDAYFPILYGRKIGYAAILIFFAALAALLFFTRRPSAARADSAEPSRGFRWHLGGSAALFLLGLYCSTGTLAPYANNGNVHQEPHNDYLYNPDHPHFKLLFQFLDGQPRSAWDGAIFFRRILFPALAYPLMKLEGFEIGGTIASLILNVAAFVGFLLVLRRTVGARGGILAGWLLALYPGAAYWGGLPYVYSIIVPASLLLTAGLLALDRVKSKRKLALIALAMGIAYLGYDLIVFFLPASVLLLCWRRRFAEAILSAAIQVLPLFSWLMVLRYGLHQSLETSNSAAFGVVLNSYLGSHDYAQWWQAVQTAPAIGLNVFFGANFLFLPTLFLLLLVINARTSRISLHPVEFCLLGAGAAIFLFNNLAPPYSGPWVLRGAQFARLYQPVFPALILFSARWCQALPPLKPSVRLGTGVALLACSAGNFLVVFGPILDNPFGVSETAFYSFATSGQSHSTYETNLKNFGRRPLGFHSHPENPPP